MSAYICIICASVTVHKEANDLLLLLLAIVDGWLSQPKNYRPCGIRSSSRTSRRTCVWSPRGIANNACWSGWSKCVINSAEPAHITTAASSKETITTTTRLVAADRLCCVSIDRGDNRMVCFFFHSVYLDSVVGGGNVFVFSKFNAKIPSSNERNTNNTHM